MCYFNFPNIKFTRVSKRYFLVSAKANNGKWKKCILCRKITSLLLNGDRRQQKLNDLWYKAIGHNNLSGDKVNGTIESKAYKELIKRCLMVKQDQIRPFHRISMFGNTYRKFNQCNCGKNGIKYDPCYFMPEFHPLLFFLHRKILPSSTEWEINKSKNTWLLYNKSHESSTNL